MTDKEKLLTLINEMQDEGICYGEHGYGVRVDNERIADHLIENVVTFQRWIPVTERLPDSGVVVLCACYMNEVHALSYDDVMDDWDTMYGRVCFRKEFVTHWMPLPEPPKEEKCPCCGAEVNGQESCPNCKVYLREVKQ